MKIKKKECFIQDRNFILTCVNLTVSLSKYDLARVEALSYRQQRQNLTMIFVESFVT